MLPSPRGASHALAAVMPEERSRDAGRAKIMGHFFPVIFAAQSLRHCPTVPPAGPVS
jgi:hypothetical protein